MNDTGDRIGGDCFRKARKIALTGEGVIRQTDTRRSPIQHAERNEIADEKEKSDDQRGNRVGACRYNRKENGQKGEGDQPDPSPDQRLTVGINVIHKKSFQSLNTVSMS